MAVTKIIAVLSRKGGVGKSTVSKTLGAACAIAGYSTLMVESDGQGSLTKGVGCADRDDFYQLILGDAEFADVIRPVPAAFVGRETENLYLVSAHDAQRVVEIDPRTPMRMVERMKEVRGFYDLVIADTSPGITEVHTGWLLSADTVLLPVLCETDSLESLPAMLSYVESAQDERSRLGLLPLQVLGILPNRYSPGFKGAQRNIGFLFGRYGTNYQVFEPIREMTAWETARARCQSIFAVKGGQERRLDISVKAAIKEFSWVADRVFAEIEADKREAVRHG